MIEVNFSRLGSVCIACYVKLNQHWTLLYLMHNTVMNHRHGHVDTRKNLKK